MMVGSGWPDASPARRVRSGRTKTRGMRKRRPATKLITIVATMALGTWVLGSWTSSHMLITVSKSFQFRGFGWESTYEMIIPVDEVAYAACRSPTQKAHPDGQPE